MMIMDPDKISKPQFVFVPSIKTIDNVLVIVFKGFQCCYRGWRDVRPCLVRVSENKNTYWRCLTYIQCCWFEKGRH